MAVWEAGGEHRWGTIQFLKYGVPLVNIVKNPELLLGKQTRWQGVGLLERRLARPLSAQLSWLSDKVASSMEVYTLSLR